VSFLKIGLLSLSLWASLAMGLSAQSEFFVRFDQSNPTRGYLGGDIAFLDGIGAVMHHGHSFVVGDQILFVEGELEVLSAAELPMRNFIRMGRLSSQGYSETEDRLLDWPVVLDENIRAHNASLIRNRPSDGRQVPFRILIIKDLFDQLAVQTRDVILGEIKGFEDFVADTTKRFFSNPKMILEVVGEESVPFNRIQFKISREIRSAIPGIGTFKALEYRVVGSRFEGKLLLSWGGRKTQEVPATIVYNTNGKLQISFKLKRWFGRYDLYTSIPFAPDAQEINFSVQARGTRIFRPIRSSVSVCWKDLSNLPFPE